MGYIQDFERELRTRLERGFDEDAIKWVKETLLQSYRNGLDVGKTADAKDGGEAPRNARNYKK